MISLVGLVVAFRVCVLWNDLAGYNLDEEVTSGGSSDGFDEGDNAWKIIHTDVLCFPPYHGLLCAVLSMSAQFLAPGTGEVIRINQGFLSRGRNKQIVQKMFTDLLFFPR